MLSKKEAKEKAANILKVAIGEAYYKLEGIEGSSLTLLEQQLVCVYIRVLGKRACKAIGKEYISY